MPLNLATASRTELSELYKEIRMFDRRFSSRRVIGVCGVAMMFIGLGGCASYTTPGRAADMRMFGLTRDQQSDKSVVQSIDKRPLAQFPTEIAVVRVQATGYESQTAKGWGHGAYSVVTQRDIENMEPRLAELEKLPMVKGLAPINRLLLPQELQSDLELRQAAAALHADMLLVYTLDTTLEVQDVAGPLTVLTLGLSPNQFAHVLCTASAVLLDTRNGYVYGVAEATEQQKQLADAWTSENAVDQTRKRVESKAFSKLVGNLQETWAGVAQTYGASAQPAAQAESSWRTTADKAD
jgi:hypothetical protein